MTQNKKARKHPANCIRCQAALRNRSIRYCTACREAGRNHPWWESPAKVRAAA